MLAIFTAAAIYVIYALFELGDHLGNMSEPELQRRAREAGRARRVRLPSFRPGVRRAA